MTTTLRLVDGDTTVTLRPEQPAATDAIFVESYDLGFPQAREATQDAAGQSGVVDLTAFHGGRTVTVEVAILDDGSLTRHQWADQLRIMCHPAKRPYLYVQQDGWMAERRVMLRGSQFSMVIDRASKARLKASLSWAAPHGVLESADVTEYRIATITSGIGLTFPVDWASTGLSFTPANSAATTTIVNNGTATAVPFYRIYGAITSPQILNSTTGETLHLPDMVVPAGEFVDIDVANRTVYLNGSPSNSYYRYIDWSVSTWWEFQPGTTLMALSASSQDSNAALLVQFRERWL